MHDCDHRLEQIAHSSIRKRYEWIMREAPTWKNRHRASDQVLADLIGECRTTVTKFLGDYPDFHPQPNRPKKMQLLEKLEAIFESYELIVDAPLVAPELRFHDDAYTLAYHHAESLQVLLSKFDAGQGLRMIGVACEQARNADMLFRAGMCVRTVLALASLVSRPEASRIEASLLEYTADARIERLYRATLESARHARLQEVRDTAAHKAVGYSGIALAYCGLHLNAPDVIQKGGQRLLAAARVPHERVHGHWPNLFRMCDLLLSSNHALGKSFASQAGEAAMSVWNDAVVYTLQERSYPALFESWENLGAGVLERLGAEEAA